MRYIILVFVALSTVYTFTYAGQTWHTNKAGASGAILLALSAIVITAIMLFTRYS